MTMVHCRLLLVGGVALGLLACHRGPEAPPAPRPTIDRSAVNWSPDGKWLTFDGDIDGEAQIFVVRTDGTGLRQVTRTHRGHGSPAFMPEGRTIAFTAESERADGTSDTDIFVVGLEDGEERFLFGQPGIEEREPQPLPDGRIGIIVRVPESDTDVGLWDPTTDSIRIVVGGPSIDVLARWADDGTLVFTSNRGGRTAGDRSIFEVFLAAPEGSGITNLGLYPDDAVGAGASSADISRDGSTVVYSSDKEGLHPFDFDHWVYDIETRTDRKIPRSPGARVGVPMISPDGRSISYAVDYDGDDVHEIAILDLTTLQVTHLHVAPPKAAR